MSTQTEATSLIERVIASLEKIAHGHKVEVVHDRDPNSSCSISVFVDGQRIDHDEYSCDSGAGYDWTDWIDSRASSIADASESVAALLRESAISPGGGEYIENMPNEEGERGRQLDALIAKYRSEPAPGTQTWTFYGHWDQDELVIDHASLGSHEDVYPDQGLWDGGSFADTGTGCTLEEAEADLRAQYEGDEDDTYTSNAFVFIQQGGASNEYYVHPHGTRAAAEKHVKSCRKAAYGTSKIFEVRGDTDFDAMQKRVDKTLGRDDWEGVYRLLAETAV